MSKLTVEQKCVWALFRDKKADFLIPDYQRPYAWTKDQCATLWEDIFSFAIPDGNADAFDSDDEYFLGPIVTFRNSEGRIEVIDGQQRLTTLMLMLRAFYSKFEYMGDTNSKKTLEKIAECIWKTDEFSVPDKDCLKIDSEVASDSDKEEFLEILKTGKIVEGSKSRYAENFSYFKDCIDDFVDKYPTYTAKLAIRVLQNLTLLPIEAESQGTALRIFSTLNDRGLPLSDADIFKSQFYKFFSDHGQKDKFVQRWRDLEEVSAKTFAGTRSNPMDELFAQYMYFERAKLGIRDTTTQSLRDFYERDSYKILKSEETLANLESLLDFWQRVANQEGLTEDEKGFSEETLRRLFVLEYAPNRMWTYFVSVYFLHNRDEGGKLKEPEFQEFLTLITGFIWSYSIGHPGVNALRTPIFPQMVRLVRGERVDFESYLSTAKTIEDQFRATSFSNNRPLTKSMLIWWAFQDKDQSLLDNDVKLEIEHIYSRKRADMENTLSSKELLECLGNKAFLEKKVNIRASDYRFSDKKKYYEGYTMRGNKEKQGTANHELIDLARSKSDFTEADIRARNELILSSFILFLSDLNLLKR